MATPAPLTSPAYETAGEQRIILNNVSWEQYVTVRDALDHIPGLRMTYLEGVLEIMSPSRQHEGIKKSLARLLEIYAVERGVDLNGYGSTTFRKQAKERGLEPDECYCVGAMKEVPDIAVEVIVTTGGIDRREVYRGLGVREVWFWADGCLTLHQLEGDEYRPIARSGFLPGLDVEELLTFIRPDDQTGAVRAYRDALRK
jgi:Uma2 family endonuclease